ncbi:exonuclease V a 5' deoxyribonuclease-domain-containing protein [Suillus paluster]|uniref:exonuclease V a 5' deoxyribonuclease-domain-containing protein n=1 Tax=Suillus paluster TaxID=48578 RepID=UPI001B878512|nr:exonuclease V a 5' deoxyribonuclease-domain-containing protein [Suillus paluster]KAG1749747.1 exonuclease V a 5' deoxyribonuclease-domain-containing protein [Suillus paluster]
MSHDEFEHYDFSEFTEEELAQFDVDATNNLLQKAPDKIPPTSQQDIRKTSISNFGGGPALEIAFESSTDVSLVEEISKPAECHIPASIGPLLLTSTHVSRMRPQKDPRNPYEKFSSWKKGFSVTDLVSPVWCEVQFEYGLYGERHKPLERRPSAFRSRYGKQIQVQQNVAQQNDRTLKRGASIHKALELEVRPETVPIRTSTHEERWALRLFNLTAGMQQLILEGLTRELPVFGITHGQVVFGIIDEVTRHAPSQVNEHYNPVKRSSASPESSPVKKKQRRSPSPSQEPIPAFYPDQSTPTETGVADRPPTEEEVHDHSVPNNSISRSIHPQPTFYDVTLVDYKTRRVPSLPPEEDAVSSKLQLMLYHRLLSALLSPETFDFDALWAKQGINSHKSFSKQFVEDIGLSTRDERDLPEFHVDLCTMIAAWVSVVHLARSSIERLRCVNPELHIIYRKAKDSFRDRQQKAKSEEKAVNSPLEALSRQEELDIARAIEESLRPLCQEAGEASTSTQAAAHIRDTFAVQSEELVLDEVDLASPALENPEPTRVMQDPLHACTQDVPDSKAIVPKEHEGTPAADEVTNLEDRTLLARNSDSPNEEDTSGHSTILGTRTFVMDDNRLDAHLEDVLQWWFGIRPPRGVELAQSTRCFNCEYQESCEWREQKATESSVALGKRKESMK